METKKELNLVMEGGGVKGIGLVGAVEALEEKEYTWAYLAGTSAGAIVATLMAVGFTGKELKTYIMKNLDFRDMMDDEETKGNFISVTQAKKWWQYLLKAPQIYGLYKKLERDHGLFSGGFIEDYVKDLIKERTGSSNFTFGDLRSTTNLNSSKLSLMVTDISNRRLLILPKDSDKLGISPDKLELAHAMRMSMSFPFFFKPVKTKTAWVMDGGVLSNFPYWYIAELKKGKETVIPTIGLLLDEKDDHAITDAKSMALALVNTMIAPLDQAFSGFNTDQRVIKIKVGDISTLEFNLDPEKKEFLYNNGRKAAERFLQKFDYEKAQEEDFLSEWSYSDDSWGTPFDDSSAFA